MIQQRAFVVGAQKIADEDLRKILDSGGSDVFGNISERAAHDLLLRPGRFIDHRHRHVIASVAAFEFHDDVFNILYRQKNCQRAAMRGERF